MENTSYIKLFRKLLLSPIFENEKALKIWIWCLLKASYREHEQFVGQQIIKLKKGQFVFGRNKASEELKMTESTLYKYIKLLESLQMISISSNNKFSVITVEKWENYQIDISEEEQQSNNKDFFKNNNKVTAKNIGVQQTQESNFAKDNNKPYNNKITATNLENKRKQKFRKSKDNNKRTTK